MDSYLSASYQIDVLQEIDRQANVFFYGPGYAGHDECDSISRVIRKCPFDPDVILVAHSWLLDVESGEVDRQPSLSLRDTELPKFLILNKEYVGIENKLRYIERERFDTVFSHQEELGMYEERTDTPFIFFPFAFDRKLAKAPAEWKKSRRNTLFFSGILQNHAQGAFQSDIRSRIMRELFFTVGWMPLARGRKLQKDIVIFWNSFPKSNLGWIERVMLNIPHKYAYKQMSRMEYINTLSDSRSCLNCLSPMGLVSTRYFEAMGCGAVALCENSERYRNLFPANTLITFKPDLSDFIEKLEYILENDEAIDAVRVRAYNHVIQHHTWQKRIEQMLSRIAV